MMEIVERALKALESIAQSLEIMTNRQDMIADDTPVTSAEPATPTTPAEPASESKSTTPSGAQELDAEGLPWDARIHGSGQTFLSDRDPKRPGCWKYIKGLQTKNPDLIAQVEAELREKYGANTEPVVEQPTTPDTSAVNTIDAPGGMFDPSAGAPSQTQAEPSQPATPVAVQQPVQQPVTQEISKEELEAACSNPVSDPKLAHINYLATKIIQRDGVAKVNEILPMYTGGVTELTKVPDNLFSNVYAVFYNQWNFHNPQGTQG